jgi:protein-L-isoaspartate(D-aspartate) O-methyltransferase
MDEGYALLRRGMVERQLRWRGIKDEKVLSSMESVPRHLFVPLSLEGYAYEDSPLPIEEGQTISQPYIVALMIQAAEVTSESRVLEIGTGSGYAAAVLSRIVKEVYTVERIETLAVKAKERFASLNYENIFVKIGDGTLGWAEKGLFDAIIVTAGAPVVPHSLQDQLKSGGRLVVPVGNAFMQELKRYRKGEGLLTAETLEFVRFVPLIGKEGWKAKEE